VPNGAMGKMLNFHDNIPYLQKLGWCNLSKILDTNNLFLKS
jgi:hypothetical protein